MSLRAPGTHRQGRGRWGARVQVSLGFCLDHALWGEWPGLLEPHFPHLQSRHMTRLASLGLLWKWHELKYIRCQQLWLAHNEHLTPPFLSGSSWWWYFTPVPQFGTKDSGKRLISRSERDKGRWARTASAAWHWPQKPGVFQSHLNLTSQVSPHWPVLPLNRALIMERSFQAASALWTSLQFSRVFCFLKIHLTGYIASLLELFPPPDTTTKKKHKKHTKPWDVLINTVLTVTTIKQGQALFIYINESGIPGTENIPRGSWPAFLFLCRFQSY